MTEIAFSSQSVREINSVHPISYRAEILNLKEQHVLQSNHHVYHSAVNMRWH